MTATISKVWEREIAQARELVAWAKANPGARRADYCITLDPEDFLDLIDGVWND